MPQLDRFLSVLVTNRAESLQLQENGPATVRKDGTDRPVTAQPLSAQQLLMLVREIAPPDAVQQLSSGTSATFRYTSSDGVFVARVAQVDGRWQASIAPESAAAAAGAAPAAGTPARAAAAVGESRGSGSISVLAERREAARADIDGLLRLMVEKSAS